MLCKQEFREFCLIAVVVLVVIASAIWFITWHNFNKYAIVKQNSMYLHYNFH